MQNFVMPYFVFVFAFRFFDREKEIAIARCAETAKIKHEIGLRACVFFVLLLPVSVENGVENLCVCVQCMTTLVC